MNYIGKVDALKREIERAFQDQSLRRRDINIEIQDLFEMPLVKVNIGRIAFLTSHQNWKEVELLFQEKVDSLS